MKLKIQREHLEEFEADVHNITALGFLEHIKREDDHSLTFSSGCRSSICGSCAIRVNGKEVLACAHKVEDGDILEPLKNYEVIRDLVVDMQKAQQKNALAKAFLEKLTTPLPALTPDDVKRNELQSDCILCGSCYSACPVLSVNENFLGPFTLTRVWKYVTDKREADTKTKIDTIQVNGVWDCTLCNECTMVCPQGISSKQDIEMLRSSSAMAGYSDPNFASFGGGFGFDGSPQF